MNATLWSMLNMTFTSPRATFEETLAFANAVRKAGGGNPLDALMPAVPQRKGECLIAKNLNFNCRVAGYSGSLGGTGWVMVVDDIEIRDRIAQSLGLEPVDFTPKRWEPHYEKAMVPAGGPHPELHAVHLPMEIRRVAVDFDKWVGVAADLNDDYPVSQQDRELLETFTPYVEASVREAKLNGYLNEQGELVL